VIDLERALTDLATHLDVPDHDGWDGDLARRLTEPVPLRRRRRMHVLAAAAAAVVVGAAGVVSVAPARHAVAGWLGIGAVEVHQSAPPPTASSRPAPTSTRPTVPPLDLDTARRQVQFPIATPRGAAPPARVTVDRRVPGGLVALAYDHFTLVEIATDPGEPTIAKFVDAPVAPVVVHGPAGMWIPSAHTIGYIDRAGNYRSDTIRRAGPVLLWTVDDVTFRVEGPHTLAEAMTIADTIV
jgi:hypothetical protein